MTQESSIHFNVRVHDRGLPTYRKRHPEIYNETEQARLAGSVSEALALTGGDSPLCLDCGTGAGNLADHFARRGARVAVADVSSRSVAVVGDRLNLSSERRFVLNGRDLTGIPSESFDLVGAYSVLHHIPDYLAAVRDMVRVVRPGGVIYLDHEAAPAYWRPSPQLQTYRTELARLQLEARGGQIRRAMRLLSPRWWRTRLRLLTNPRFQPDGDIHVWPDDHVQWDDVVDALNSAGAAPIVIRDYLLCRGNGPFAELHQRSADRCEDMRLAIFRRG